MGIRVGNSIIRSDHQIELLVFCDQKSDSLVKKNDSFPSLFFEDRRDRFAHGCSFVKSDRSDSLTVAFFIKSDERELIPSIFKKERLSKEQLERLTLLA